MSDHTHSIVLQSRIRGWPKTILHKACEGRFMSGSRLPNYPQKVDGALLAAKSAGTLPLLAAVTGIDLEILEQIADNVERCPQILGEVILLYLDDSRCFPSHKPD